MKKFIVCLFAIAFVINVSADLIITKAVDGTLSGGLPKALEIANTGSTSLDLSNYKIGRYANGGTSPSTFTMSGTIAAKSVKTIAGSDTASFTTVWGFAADMDNSILSGNGNDVYAILNASDDSVVDVFGTIGSSANYYQDSFGERTNAQINANSTYDSSEWKLPGNNYMDGFTASQISNAIPTMGVYGQIPEPATFGLIGLALLFFRRK